MTKKQIDVCKAIKKHQKLNTVLKKCKIPDYWELQLVVPPEYIEFSDSEMDDNTKIFLSDEATEIVERWDWEHRKWSIPLAISILSLLVSIAALFLR